MVRVQFVVPSARGTKAGANLRERRLIQNVRALVPKAQQYSHAANFFLLGFVIPRGCLPRAGAATRALLRAGCFYGKISFAALFPSPRVFHSRAVVESQRRISNRILIMMVQQIFDVSHHRHAVPHRELRSQIQT